MDSTTWQWIGHKYGPGNVPAPPEGSLLRGNALAGKNDIKLLITLLRTRFDMHNTHTTAAHVYTLMCKYCTNIQLQAGLPLQAQDFAQSLSNGPDGLAPKEELDLRTEIDEESLKFILLGMVSGNVEVCI
jgi:hypothetical protein